MTLTDQNVTVVRGDTARIAVSIVDEDGNPKDLTGSTIEWSLGYPNDVQMKKDSNGVGVVIVDALNGELRLDFTPLETQLMESDHHRLKITDQNTDVSTVLTGFFKIKE